MKNITKNKKVKKNIENNSIDIFSKKYEDEIEKCYDLLELQHIKKRIIVFYNPLVNKNDLLLAKKDLSKLITKRTLEINKSIKRTEKTIEQKTSDMIQKKRKKKSNVISKTIEKKVEEQNPIAEALSKKSISITLDRLDVKPSLYLDRILQKYGSFTEAEKHKDEIILQIREEKKSLVIRKHTNSIENESIEFDIIIANEAIVPREYCSPNIDKIRKKVIENKDFIFSKKFNIQGVSIMLKDTKN